MWRDIGRLPAPYRDGRCWVIAGCCVPRKARPSRCDHLGSRLGPAVNHERRQGFPQGPKLSANANNRTHDLMLYSTEPGLALEVRRPAHPEITASRWRQLL